MIQETNKAIVRSYLQEFVNKGNLTVFDTYLAKDAVFNSSKDFKSLLISRAKTLHTAFPDHHLTIEDQIAEGDRVVTRVIFHGTHQGEFNGVAATGRAVAYSGIAIDRIADGKVVEMWHLANTASLMQQINIAKAPASTK